MKQKQAISRLVVVLSITIVLMVLVAGVTFESGFLFHIGQSTTESSQSTVTTESFNSNAFQASNSYFAFMLDFHTQPSAVGIASYGIFNYSGSLRAYSINTTEVVGEANITSLSASTSWDYRTYPPLNSLACTQCASLQMNVNVVVKTNQGSQILWVQNVVPFSNITSQEIVDFYGLIFNMTTSNANVTSSSSGNGHNGELQGKTTYAFGSFSGSITNYSLPLHVKLGTSVAVYNGGIEIKMSDTPFGNGAFAANNDTFGIVNIPIKNVTSASIVVMPSLYPRTDIAGLYRSYNSNLVWAAYCCGQTTNFTEMNSTLSLEYLNSNNQLESYPSFYTFGFTGESATNLRVVPYHNGGQVALGQDNNSLLEN